MSMSLTRKRFKFKLLKVFSCTCNLHLNILETFFKYSSLPKEEFNKQKKTMTRTGEDRHENWIEENQFLL